MAQAGSAQQKERLGNGQEFSDKYQQPQTVVVQGKDLSAESASAMSSFQEQKNWITSLLTTASAAGEEQIRFSFPEDKHLAEGCAACGPDFDGGDLEVDHIQRKTENGTVTSTWSTNQTQIWNSNRSCLSLQSCCWKFYNTKLFRWLFRGGEYSGDTGKSSYPNVEPAQKFRCGWKMLQERGFVLLLLFLLVLGVVVAAFPLYLRLVNKIFISYVDYSKIRTFKITCNGCKVQISNNINWAGFFAPCNTNLFFPADGCVWLCMCVCC